MPKVRTRAGLDVAVHDLGGEGPDLLLLHATGFHGRTWLPVGERLRGHFHALAVDERAHGDSGLAPGVSLDWRDMAADVLEVIDAMDLGRPLGAGHSCGATLVLLAEEARPGTFSALYCFEPIMATADDPPPPQDNAMAAAARRRREVFASRDAAFALFAGKPPLSALSADVLEAYVNFGFDDLADGTVRLKCRAGDEARTYEHGLSHDAYRRLGEVTCRVTLACGERTDTVGLAALEALAARLPDARTEVLPDLGHLGPLEDPAAVAASMVAALGD